MPIYRSKTSTSGRNMAGARALWRATGMTDSDFQKPIIAVCNSFTQFVPVLVLLLDIWQLVARLIEKSGGVAQEFNTISVYDCIAICHDCFLYSFPFLLFSSPFPLLLSFSLFPSSSFYYS